MRFHIAVEWKTCLAPSMCPGPGVICGTRLLPKFCGTRFNCCLQDNEQRKLQEERAAARRIQQLSETKIGNSVIDLTMYLSFAITTVPVV